MYLTTFHSWSTRFLLSCSVREHQYCRAVFIDMHSTMLSKATKSNKSYVACGLLAEPAEVRVNQIVLSMGSVEYTMRRGLDEPHSRNRGRAQEEVWWTHVWRRIIYALHAK